MFTYFWLYILLIILVTDTFFFFEFRKTVFKTNVLRISYFALTIVMVVASIVYFKWFMPSPNNIKFHYINGTVVSAIFVWYLPKLIFVILMLISKFIEILKFPFSNTLSRVLTSVFVVVWVSCFAVSLWGITYGRTDYKVDNVDVKIDGLPKSFEGFQIVQLSDLHLGSFSDKFAGFSKMIKIVNAQKPDLIIFSGDMVNSYADESTPWIDQFSDLRARYGKFAVMGNHDYGDYVYWKNDSMRNQNITQLKKNISEMGFDILDNESRFVVIDGDTLNVIGVENWGERGFKKAGKLDVAMRNIAQSPSILLSHDPSHWRAQVLNTEIDLTFSGHTHAMQMGVDLPFFRWSPSQYIYPEYRGLYSVDNKYLHVSAGQGYIGFAGRVGLRPVISVITLRCFN